MTGAAPVASAADLSARPGLVMIVGTSGTWAAGTITVASTPALRVDGSPALRQAVCTFTYTGATPPPASSPVTKTTQLTLSPTGICLLAGGESVLRSGDSVTDEFGNSLSVLAEHPLRA